MAYDQQFKDEVADYAIATNCAKAAREYDLNDKTVRNWKWKRERALEAMQESLLPEAPVATQLEPQPVLPPAEPLPSPIIHNPVIQEHKTSRVLAIPDLHCPFEHPDALEFCKAVYRKYGCNRVVCLGDEIDAHAFSRYPMDPEGLSAGKEIKEAVARLQHFYEVFPDVLVCESNHTVRPWKKGYEAGLPDTFLRTVEQILNVPDGWRYERFHKVDGVLYMHGDNGKSGQYAAANYMKQAKQSVVIGHIHAYASVFYEGSHFGMNAGCLIDKAAYAFKYAKGSVLDVNIGCGVVIDGAEAYFVPMRMDASRRWTGEL